MADGTADFVYARLQQAREDEPTGYDPGELDRWTELAKAWAAGEAPAGLAYADAGSPPKKARDVLLFMINGAKVSAPTAAQGVIVRPKYGEKAGRGIGRQSCRDRGCQ